jgi:hypothetical protein
VTTAPISCEPRGWPKPPRLDPGRITLDGIADAYAAVRNQSAAGKIVIDID